MFDKVLKIIAGNEVTFPYAPEDIPRWFINVTFSIIGLIIAAPLILFIWLIIKLDSPGPAIFKQTRIGMNRRRREQRASNLRLWPDQQERRAGERRMFDLNGRPFTFYKFRTMQVNARKLYPELYKYDYNDAEIQEICFKVIEDPRLTVFGRWLRKTTLDELPNLINILTGDMSLVGPRPDIPEMMQYYTPKQRAKFNVKPGVTGLAQINGRGLLSFQDTIKEDLEYVKSRSLALDMKILFKTICAVVKRKGAF